MKKSLIALSISSILVGCGGGSSSSENSTPSKTAITKMSSVAAGFQTFQPRNHSVGSTSFRMSRAYSGTTQIDDGESDYVYQNPETGEQASIIFEGEGETGDAVALPAPEVVMVVDLNENFSAIQFTDVTIHYGGEELTGNYTLIQDKATGSLYPLIEDGQPILVTTEAEHETWVTSARFSYAADTNGIYFRHGENKGLHSAKLIGDAFVIETLFDDYVRNNWVLPNGDVVSVPWSQDTINWIDRASAEKYSVSYDFTNRTNPFIYNETLYIVDTNANEMLALSINETKDAIVETSSGWTTNGYRTDINNNTVRRGKYEMQPDCSVYKFDPVEQEITQVNAAVAYTHSFAPMAGQNSLYCLHASGDDLNTNSTPTFERFDIIAAELGQPAVDSVIASIGNGLNANERMAVINDSEVMFYEYPNSAIGFDEYYVNFDTGLTTKKEVTQATVIKMQTVAEQDED